MVKAKKRQEIFVGAKIRQLRKERNVTQAELAQKIGVQQSDLCRMENGEYKVSLETLFNILSLFEINIAEFFKDVLKALLDSRVKTLYICMRNHSYKGSKKSGYLKVKDSLMVQQYISLAKLYKLDIFLVDLFPRCNEGL